MNRHLKGLLSVFLTAVLCLSCVLPTAASEPASTADEQSFVYLSDIEYESASIGYGKVHLDGNMNDARSSLIVDGSRFYFDKSITAHAPSTLVYNLSGYEQYKYFTAQVGIDASQGSKGNAIFHIYTSTDGSEWTQVYVSGALTAASESEFVSVDISQAGYLKLYADANGGNGNDHTTFADAKLSNSPSGFETSSNVFKSVEEYDEELNALKGGSNNYLALLDNEEFEHTLLQRTFVANAGYRTLSVLCSRNQKYADIINWLLNDNEALSLYITGGKPSGSYEKSLDTLYELYTAHGEDMSDSLYGPLYKKMIITLSLTHAETVYAWQDTSRISDPVRRYEIYKELHSDGLLWNDIFENLTVEEMRWVLNAQIDDNEIKALNTYVREHNNLSEFTYENWCGINGYSYITYTLDYSYPANPSIFDIFENGSVCGGISKSSVNIRQVFGIPGATLNQPGHCAWLDYRYIDGECVVYIGNNVSGWTKSKREEDRRMPCEWGNNSWKTRDFSASYALLSKTALGDSANYDKALKLNAMAEVFGDEAESIYRTAIEAQSINLDSFYGLIMAMSERNVDDAEALQLINEIENSFYAFPLPMWDLINLAKNKFNITSDIATAEIMLSSYNALMDGVNITSESTNQPDVCKTMAQDIINSNSFALADFSLVGDDAGIIRLSDVFSETARLEYSIDGGESFICADGKEAKLTDEQLSALSTETDILVRLEGMENYYKIDLTKAQSPKNLYNNDLENRVINATDSMQWSYDEVEWTTFGDEEPDLSGDKTVYVRTAAGATTFPSDSVALAYTADEANPKKSYIKLNRVSVFGCSSEQASQKQQADKAIDGDINTYWHTNWAANSDLERYIILELDKETKLSAVEYVPRQDGNNGRFTSCEIYTSLDGESWTLAGSASGWAVDKTSKTVTLDEPVLAKYVKVVGASASANFGSAAMINLFEDISVTSGDVNFDGKITVADAVMIQKHIANIIQLSDEEFAAADVDENNKLTVADAVMIQKHIANIITLN